MTNLYKVGDCIQIEERAPKIFWKHIDGPVLHLTDASVHWLTYKERFLLFFKLTSIQKLDFKYSRLSEVDKRYIYSKYPEPVG